jgi:hypothetical protein
MWDGNKLVKKGIIALHAKVEKFVFVDPSRMRFKLPDGKLATADDIDYCERPLRINAFPVQRVAVARSESLPEGTTFKCGIEVFPSEITEDVLRDLLDYGYRVGLLGWRGSDKGSFIYDLKREE